MTEMRILTVRQPWAWAIIHGGKDIENRSRNLAGSYRGLVAIHAGKSYDSAWQSSVLDDAMQASGARRKPGDPPWWGHLGMIIGVIDLVDVHHSSADDLEQWLGGVRCSRWAEPDGWHLEFANPRPLAEPIPYKGALGLRRFNETVDAGILHQLEALA